MMQEPYGDWPAPTRSRPARGEGLEREAYKDGRRAGFRWALLLVAGPVCIVALGVGIMLGSTL